MKVLVAHNRYKKHSPSGENTAVDREIALLLAANADVDFFVCESDDIGVAGGVSKLAAARASIRGSVSSASFLERLERFRPDIVHLHNPYPLLSPRVIDMARSFGVPTVVSVHNYRLACINGLLFRGGRVCTQCLDAGSAWAGIRHACYRSSFAESAVMGLAITRNRRHYDNAARFLAVSEFVAAFLRNLGIEDGKISVKPNSAADPGEPGALGAGFLYVGRLSEEKGVRLLLEAWQRAGIGSKTTLTFVGAGPLSDMVTAVARREPSIRYLGPMNAQEVASLRAATAICVLPSVCHEAHPLSAVESLAAGRPIVATKRGGLEGLALESHGWVSEPNADALARVLEAASSAPDLAERAVSARSIFLSKYSDDTVIDRQLEIYRDVIERFGSP